MNPDKKSPPPLMLISECPWPLEPQNVLTELKIPRIPPRGGWYAFFQAKADELNNQTDVNLAISHLEAN